MKTLKSMLFFLTITMMCQVQAQKSAFEYLKQVPKMPDSICTCSQNVRQNYETAVGNLLDIIKEDAQSRTRADEDYMDQNKEQIKESMMKEMASKTGMSQEELEALKNKKKMSKEDKQAMANKMLGQYGLSMGEVKNMKNMDENAKKAWAQGYATEQMAMAQANKGNTKMQADNDKAMNNVKLLQEQEQLRGQIGAFENEITSRFSMLIQNSGKEKLDEDLQKLSNELRNIKTIYECNECPAPPQKDIDHWNSVIKKIHDAKIQYCRQNTPKLLDYLKWYKTELIKYIPVYDRAEEIQHQVTSATTNTQLSFPGKGAYSLNAVEGYVGAAKDLFHFKIYDVISFAGEFYK